jgi:hypothetical protein
MPAADVEGAVLDHVQKLLAAPELVARTWVVAKREGEITEREVTTLLAEFATVWNELFPAEQGRMCSCSSSGSTWRRTHSKCESGPKEWRAWSGDCGSRAKGRRHDPGPPCCASWTARSRSSSYSVGGLRDDDVLVGVAIGSCHPDIDFSARAD